MSIYNPSNTQRERFDALELGSKSIERKLEALGFHVAELRRKSQGTTKANTRAAKLEQDLAKLIEVVSGITSRIDNLGENAGIPQIEAFTAEIGRLDRKVDGLWVDLNAELEKLRGRVDEHDKRLDNHDTKFASHGERIEAVEVTVNAHTRAIASIRSRGGGSGGIHPTAYLIGVITGIIAGIIWSAKDWSQKATVGGMETIVPNDGANSIWAAIACGIGVGLLALFIMSLFLRRNDDETEVNAEAEAGAVVVTGNGHNNSTLPPPPVGPTQVNPVYDAEAEAQADAPVHTG